MPAGRAAESIDGMATMLVTDDATPHSRRRPRRNAAAVRTGQVETARVITAAATIMICVFLTFSFTGQRDIAEFGIGLAAAVALDAFILRTVLVPAAMHIFGTANWWLPRWLDRRLPHLAIEPRKSAPAPPVPVQQGALR